ncbi:MAG: DUF3459 domain-containing protein, partial [Alphaproteobacteria bacterium]
GPDAAARRALYRRLLAIRRDEIVPRLDGARALGARAIGPKAVDARWRLGDGAILRLAVNFAAAPVALDTAAGRPLFATSGVDLDPLPAGLDGIGALALIEDAA